MNSIARIISIVGHPLITVPLITGIILIQLEGNTTGLKSLGILLALSILPATIWMYVKSRKGSYTNFDVSNQKQRSSLFVFILVLLTLTTILLYVTDQPNYLNLGVLIATCLITISFFVNYSIKSSLHVSLNTYMALSLSLLNISVAIGLFVFTIIIGWSRIVLKRHTFTEVCIGLLLGIVAGVVFLQVQAN